MDEMFLDEDNDAELNRLIKSSFQPCLEALTSGETASLADCAVYVAAHPFFTISQKSHELFHSGMLAWMMKAYPAFASIVFDEPWMSKARLRVETEIERRDITIWDEETGCCYVIENKFKSFYSPIQLSEYGQRLSKESGVVFKKGVVLGLIEGIDDNRLRHPWEYLNYYELLAGLKSTFDTLVARGELKDRDSFIIEQYLEFLDALLSLLSPFRINMGESEWGVDPSLATELSNLEILEFVKKMQAHAFSEYVRLEWVRRLYQMYATVEISTPYTFGAEGEVRFDIFSLSRSLPAFDPRVQIQIILTNEEIVRRVRLVGKCMTLKVLEKWNDGQALKKERVYQYLTPVRIIDRKLSSISKQLQREVKKAVSLVPEILSEMGYEPKCCIRTETRR